MYESTKINIKGYTPVGDIIVIALCMIMAVLLWQTHINKNTKFRAIMLIVMTTWVSSVTNVIYEMMIYSEHIQPFIIYTLRTIHHLTLTFIPCMYIQYLRNPLWIPNDTRRQYGLMFGVAISIVAIFDIMGTVFHYNFYIDENNVIHHHFNPYMILYVLLMSSIFYMIIKYRTRVIRQIFYGLLGVNIVSALMVIIQGICNQTSYTCISYFFPVIAIIFMFHSNPYDIKTGAVAGCFLINELSESVEKKTHTIMLSITMKDFSKAVNQYGKFKSEFYGFCRRNIKKGILYHFPDERIVLTMPKKSDNDCQKLIDNIVNSFRRNIYSKFNIDYKIVIMETCEEVGDADDYIKIIDHVEQKMSMNELHTVNQNDIKNYYSSNYILSQLEDIVLKKDLNDERILVYCQPVFNLLTNSYDTAEALMRLKLNETGLVFPDQFIPLAEQYNMIHTLSMIILNKTCRAIHDIICENYEINRISVNFSALDIKYDTFCQEVQDIIEQNEIPYDKIAVEITESRCEADFNVMRQKVTQLQQLGIKFYLDDFGTGYSNFERIMEIPFNIIKFDRSMLIESVKNDSSKFMVSTFASMFNELNYAVLFEGVENDYDETHCVNMNAKYLQGYKYSKPIPIEQLKNFLQRSAV
ncbi:MAG: EAL domain-containing protein [Ruminococcus flavefaciens]|nr:EAL domain-containing protein [Ruminococcus flavefaciens]